jgi:uncharacterized protein with HEPN domain
MSSAGSYVDYLNDMLDAIDKAEQFISGLDYEDFVKDEKTIFAVIRALEILGEASNKTPTSIQQKYKDIPWREIRGMRNKLIHDYMGVNIEVVWKTTNEDLSELRSLIQNLKDELESS